MEDFSRKVRLVDGGHMIDTPATVTYAKVVSCGTFCLDPVTAVLNDLKVKCGDVENAYITSST